MTITPEKCRAARAMLGMSQEELCAAAGISRTTLVFFERGERSPEKETLAAIEKALTRPGVVFVDKVGHIGPAPTRPYKKR